MLSAPARADPASDRIQASLHADALEARRAKLEPSEGGFSARCAVIKPERIGMLHNARFHVAAVLICVTGLL
jgi:hypothetical protein